MADLSKRKRSSTSADEQHSESKEKKLKTSVDLFSTNKKKAPGFSDKIFSETTYLIKDGLRYVKPYYFTFESYAKGRWEGRTIFDVFSKEFQSEKPAYYKKAIETGKITVGGEKVTMGTIVRQNILVRHKIHRHEPPVLNQPLNIVHQDEDIVVIDKPPSIPVHPCGRYRHNTVVFILAKEHGIKHVHTIHRIDRLTSGILMFAKSLRKAQQIEAEILEKTVKKIYLARVVGKFPEEAIECNESIVVVSHKLGVCHVDPIKGKSCSTSFHRLHYNGRTSIVKCVPKTGRMHQIRVHLQWLGYPILHDPLYNHPAWGPERGCQGKGIQSMDKVLAKIVESRFVDDIVNDSATTNKLEESPNISPSPEAIASIVSDNICERSKVDKTTSIMSPECDTSSTITSHVSLACPTSGSENITAGSDKPPEPCTVNPPLVPVTPSFPKDSECTECQLNRTLPSPSEFMMCLHALEYSGKGWEYKTQAPYWAHENWIDTV